MAQLTIIGYEQECSCDHCGRSLKHGIKVGGLGTIGADCFNKMIKADRKKFSGNGKPGASYIRMLAKLKERDNPQTLRNLGYGDWSFTFEAA